MLAAAFLILCFINCHCCWHQCNLNITVILDIAPEDNRGIRSGDWWSGHGSLLFSPMIMQMHVEREYPVSVLSVQALTVFLVSEDIIPLCLFAKKEESYVVADVTAQHTVTFLPLICSVISLML
jgi:hypothetical protein